MSFPELPTEPKSYNILSPDYAEEFFRQFDEPTDAVPTPFPTMNREWCRDEGDGVGIGPNWIVTIGGGTGSGKSLLALNFVAEAVSQGREVGFMSLEMTHRQITSRLYAMLMEEHVQRFERGAGHDKEAARRIHATLEEWANRISPKMFVNEDPLPSIYDMTALMEEWAEWGCELFVIDYLQLCSAPDEDGKAQQLEAIMNAVRAFAKQGRNRVIGLSQYTIQARRNAKLHKQPPSHDDYIGSSAISNNSHLCLCLDDSRYIRREQEAGGRAKTWLTNTKSRVGPPGEIPIEWDYTKLMAREADPDEEHEWPGNQ